MNQDRRVTDSGIELRPVYGPEDLEGFDPGLDLGAPGQPPFTRGVHPSMYRGRLWTMRQYAGFGTAEETNARFRYLLEHGQTGLSVGLRPADADGLRLRRPARRGRGRPHRRRDRLDRRTWSGCSTGSRSSEVSTSMTINATAARPAAALRARRRGAGRRRVDSSRGTVQNDMLKEYVARGTYIYPPSPSMRLTTDLFAYCGERHAALEHDLDLRLPHPRGGRDGGAGDRVHARERASRTCRRRSTRGSRSTSSRRGCRSSSTCHNNFFEEVAKFRAARRMWAQIMRERFGATDPRSAMLRFHTQTGGATLTAQQPENNIVRVALQALAAVLRRHAVAAHELVRRGARAAHRARGEDRAAHPADHRARVRRGRHAPTRSAARTSSSRSPTSSRRGRSG